MVNTNVNARLNSYSLGEQHYEKSDPEILREIDRVMNQQPGQELCLGHAITVGAHGLDSVEKAILVAWWCRLNRFTRNHCYKCVIAAIR